MTMYRISKGNVSLIPFRSDELGTNYLEKDLEDWFEANPIVLTDGEPAMIIGRQVNTGWGGTIDLLGLDAEGAALVVELKRAPTPRDILAQALEYAAWVAGLDSSDMRSIAESYLAKADPAATLEERWALAFGTEVQEESGDFEPITLTEINLNLRQRTFVVIEGRNERVEGTIRYLRSHGIDINLLEYTYYQTEGGEEFLDIESRVGGSASIGETKAQKPVTQEALLANWPQETVDGFHKFRNKILTQEGMSYEANRTLFSFYKMSRDGRVFITSFSDSARVGAYISYRKDSLASYLDIDQLIDVFRSRTGEDVSVRDGSVWVSVHFPVPSDYPTKIADIVIHEMISKVR